MSFDPNHVKRYRAEYEEGMSGNVVVETEFDALLELYRDLKAQYALETGSVTEEDWNRLA